MSNSHKTSREGGRKSAHDMSPAEFRALGHGLVDTLASYYESLPERPLTLSKDRGRVRELLGTGSLPDNGAAAGDLLAEIVPTLLDHSLHNGHPRFLGYISASASPFGALADLLASAINVNLAKWELSPVASEIETQAVQWIAELIDYPGGCGGLMVSGGNSANLHGFIAARQARASWDLRRDGMQGAPARLIAYASRETHTWIEKAAEICGLGSGAIRWVETDDRQRLRLDDLAEKIAEDRRLGHQPFLVVGTAGTVSTGAIDPLVDLSAICRREGLWFHVDGAYGAPAARLEVAPDDLKALALADSVAVDPHKWLHVPIEAACILTRDPNALRDAFDFRPNYYHFNDDNSAGIDYYQHGLQNSRGFRALKVWLGLRRAGLHGCLDSVRDDIALATLMYRSLTARADFDARSLGLSIVAFRYTPPDLGARSEQALAYLNELNQAILASVQAGGDAFVSNAVVGGDYLLRACVCNFRTTAADIEAVIELVAETGRSLDRRMRPAELAA